MVTTEQADDVLAAVSDALHGIAGREAALHAACAALERRLPHLDGAAVYLFDNGVLNLDAHTGAAGRRTLIPVGQGGAVGEAAAAGHDVLSETTDPAGGATRAEAAVLIRDADTVRLLGVLQVVGADASALDPSDLVLLAAVAQRLAPRLLDPPA